MRIIPLLIASCLVTTACVRTSTDPVTGRVDVDVESPTKQGEDWDAKLTSATNPSVQGTAQARVLEGTTQITVNVTGLPTTEGLTWHVHDGGCGTGGPVVGSASQYPALTVAADGRVSGSATLNVRLEEAKTYSVDVHSSGSDMSTRLACGELSD